MKIEAAIDTPQSPRDNSLEFERELRGLLNRYSMENRSDTPDFVLARYMVQCLHAYENATSNRRAWHINQNTTECFGKDNTH